ncbi:hypothetical protein [Orenia metallireducens]|uniref:hypothetical protein n=1 Tax=Orenia metallireducens TaxID=1413210 RepID=UPI00159F040C|nr:hypothetical protein [Orenia metallireducens]
MKVSDLLKEQLEKLCKVNTDLLNTAKKRELTEEEIQTLDIVNHSIYRLGSLFEDDMYR